MSKFALQREIHEPGSRGGQWFDAETFDTKDRALMQLKHRRWEAQARIYGRGGSGYTGERAQRMRIVELIDETPTPSQPPEPSTGMGV